MCFFNGPITASFILVFALFMHFLHIRHKQWTWRVSNSDLWRRRQAPWPLDHQHGPCGNMFHVYQLVLTIRPLFNQLSLFSTMSINLEVCLKKQRSRCIVLGCEPRISRFRSDHSTNCVMPLLLNRSELSENLQFFTPKQINPLACCDCNKELCLFT